MVLGVNQFPMPPPAAPTRRGEQARTLMMDRARSLRKSIGRYVNSRMEEPSLQEYQPSSQSKEKLGAARTATELRPAEKEGPGRKPTSGANLFMCGPRRFRPSSARLAGDAHGRR